MAVTNQQKRLYMLERKKGQTQALAAAKAGFSERTARKIEKGTFQPSNGKPRHWRTRKDPFEEVWEKVCIPLLREHTDIQANTLLEILQERYENQFPDSLLRTLQRRIKKWKALYGPEKEIIFRQNHPPGEMGISDFTQIKNYSIFIDGKEFKHLFYHFRLSYSGFTFIKVIHGGESYTALTESLQQVFQILGGCPKVHRTDHLSAAYKNLKQHEKEDMTQRYEAFCSHYNVKPSRNNLGKSHENGSIESPHGHFKNALKQHLIKRGSFDFKTLDEYSTFLETVVNKINSKRSQKIIEEKSFLQPLPFGKAVDYTELSVKVTSSSTINVRLIVYSVPSRLIGSTLKVHLYDDRLELFLNITYVMTITRVYAKKGKRRGRSIDYKHLISSLYKKPSAFYRFKLRNELFPNDSYRKIWEIVDEKFSPKEASRWMVGVLNLVAKTQQESQIALRILKEYETFRTILTLNELKNEFEKVPRTKVEVKTVQHSLESYDELLVKKGKQE